MLRALNEDPVVRNSLMYRTRFDHIIRPFDTDLEACFMFCMKYKVRKYGRIKDDGNNDSDNIDDNHNYNNDDNNHIDNNNNENNVIIVMLILQLL